MSKEFENFSTERLIDLCQTSGHPNRDEAFFQIVYRFREKILNLCEIRCNRFNQNINVAEQLANTVFERYYEKGNFNPDKGKSKTVDESFLLYLAAIAKNELTNIFRDQKRKIEGKWSDGLEKIVTEIPDLPKNPSDENLITYKILNELPYKHLVIYLTYLSYENTGSNLPKHLLKQLRETLNISQNTIRTYKKEAIDKIKSALEIYKSYNQNSNE